MSHKITFISYYLVGFLKSMGWPRKVGVPLVRKNVVDAFIVRMAIQEMVRFAIVLGAKRPDIAICLIADMFGRRDFKQQSAAELWAWLDPTHVVTSHPQISPVEAIARFFADKDTQISLGDAPSQKFLPWDFVVSETIGFYSHLPFAKALVWGIEHPEEALTAYEAERARFQKRLPEMISAGVKLQPPSAVPTSDEVCESIQEVIASYQNEVRPFCTVPHDLLAVPSVARRMNGRQL